ncbi:hypothetical protein AWM75_02710 [Aerococcus urinaehominis]|uniref:non-specific serine/threonine protein kinase n=1 Tax=Aerococcus urinaehominis TaxID=128944 RepID=A0A0X8FKF9_9LACT|nr:Stk1 family PASTA domain-containing Ser/Thr kinase [Aerococcus urinaehominis]AMB98973.1 hypothetical protein AWM75_02710 [Aerococcus urinaehominis]SDM37443.1 serine/threonine protein kinase [Aerococcus urinaehominis]
MNPGQIIDDRYEIIDLIGTGGMADVYLAYDPILARQVAIKFLRVGSHNLHDAIIRFQREANAVSEINHPNIVNIYDVGIDRNVQFIVMEYVDGLDLKTYIQTYQPLPIDQACDITLQILAGIQAAHQQGIIHRDLKPQNIKIKDDGQVKVMDFGIATVSSETSITRTNAIIGSVHYLSPEQARGAMATAQSDIYSIGIVLFELLTGTIPFEGESAVTIALKHFQEPLPDIRDYRADVPNALINVVQRATAKKVTERYRTTAEMISDLQTALDSDRAGEAILVTSHVPEESLLLAKEDIEGQIGTSEETILLNEGLTPVQAAPLVEERPAFAADSATESQDQVQIASSSDKQGKIKINDPDHQARMKKWLLMASGVLAILVLAILAQATGLFAREVTVPDLQGLSQAEAASTLADHQLQVGDSDYEYHSQIASDQIIASQPKAGSHVKEESQVDLIISQGPEPVQVGNYVGSQFEQVKKDLEKAGFTVNRIDDYSETVGQDKVISQSIAPGESVIAQDTAIDLTVSLGRQTFQMPDLTGWAQSDVEAYAEEYGLSLATKQEKTGAVPSGTVLDQSIGVGQDFHIGDKLSVTIAQEPEKVTFRHTVTIPYKANNARQSSEDTAWWQGVKDWWQGQQVYASLFRRSSNEIKVYMDDLNHSYDTPADTFSISSDRSYTMTFETEKGETARFKIERDGEVIMENKVKASED